MFMVILYSDLAKTANEPKHRAAAYPEARNKDFCYRLTPRGSHRYLHFPFLAFVLDRRESLMSAMLSRALHVASVITIALMLGMTPALAQSGYPSRPIKLVVSYPPGALTDLLARAIGERL